MDTEEKNQSLEISTEERTAEEEMTKEVNEEELRTKLAEEMGIDPDEQEELLDKLVAREKANHEKLSGAIKQKINWRTKAQGNTSKPEVNPKEGNTQSIDLSKVDELVDQKLNERLEQRELDSLSYPDEIKAEIKRVAKIEGISIREASQNSYVKYKISEFEKEERIRQATPRRSSKGSGYTPSYDPSKPLNVADFDLNTEEGRKAWNDAKEARRKHQANQ